MSLSAKIRRGAVHSGAGVAVSRGVAGGAEQSMGDVPTLHYAYRSGAGRIEFKDLVKPGP